MSGFAGLGTGPFGRQSNHYALQGNPSAFLPPNEMQRQINAYANVVKQYGEDAAPREFVHALKFAQRASQAYVRASRPNFLQRAFNIPGPPAEEHLRLFRNAYRNVNSTAQAAGNWQDLALEVSDLFPIRETTV
jgi:hypothetical protein